ncbi:hypothetical protein ACHAW6_015429 [Cyclotella cf. meneghiniana]
MNSFIIASMYWLSIPTFPAAAFVPPLHTKCLHTISSPKTSLSMSFVADSSDYKPDKSDFDDTSSADTSSSSPGSRGDDDMADAPTIEETPVPMSRNNVGNRWVAIVFDRDLSKMYNGEVWEGESSASVLGTFDDGMDDDDDDGEEIDYAEEEQEVDEEDVHVPLPKFKQEEESPDQGFQPMFLEILERNNREVVWEEYNNDHILWKMHNQRVALTEDHVMWARKQNLYNETFNTGSMADVLWSHQLLSSDLQRTIGHAMCLDSPTLEHCREALSRDPIIRSILGVDPQTGECDVSSVPLYRWRHIRDHTLRRDDGRDGRPNMLLAFDRPEAMSDGVREEHYNKHLEYMIRSDRVIAAGPLHVATEEKMDPKSIPIGTLMLFNAMNRDHAIDFVENDPFALEGLYETMTVHRYNSLDVTGKFVSENLYFPNQETYQMKEAMEYWGYPVDDDQTKWLNW